MEKEQRKSQVVSDTLTVAGSGSTLKAGNTAGPIGHYIKDASSNTGKMDIARAEAARFYIYGKHHFSKSTFDDETFCDRLRAYFVAGGGQGDIKFLTRKWLIYYIRGEFSPFKLFLKHLIA